MINELYHHGIKGQRWGVRRYQNEDGTLTSAGYKRRAKQLDKRIGELQQDTARLEAQYHNASGGIRKSYDQFNKYRTKYENLSDKQKASWRGRRLEKKGKDWLARSIESAAIASLSKDNMQWNIEETHRLLKHIQNDPNFLTYQQRRATDTYYTKGDKIESRQMLKDANFTYHKKAARRTYDNNYATRTLYDRTRVRYASEKERKKNKKRRTDWKDSELQRVQYYYI